MNINISFVTQEKNAKNPRGYFYLWNKEYNEGKIPGKTSSQPVCSDVGSVANPICKGVDIIPQPIPP